MPNFEALSERDRHVLKCIFDPTLTIGDVSNDEDTFLHLQEDACDEVDSSAALHARELEARAVKLTDTSSSDSDRKLALDLLNQAAALAPRAATYNNRAQVLRLLGRDEEAMVDLEEALRLTAGNGGRARAQALCQRALLLRKQGRDDDARRDYAEAARMGSAFAKKQVAEMNPYAALCNQMLQQVMRGDTHVQQSP